MRSLASDFFRKSPYFLVIIHLTVLALFYWLMIHFNYIDQYPSNANLVHWDANWYKLIIKKGFEFHPGIQSSVAFNPLFPYLWKYLGVSAVGISILNLFMFLSGMLLLRKAYHLSASEFLILLSVPSLFFCYIPYSEALFFLGGTMLLVGSKQEKFILSISGLIIACLTRSVSVIFIPILVFTFFSNSFRNNYKKQILYFLALALTSLIILYLVKDFKEAAVGATYTITQVQSAWGKALAFPKLPLTSWDGSRLIWLDGLALLIGLISIYKCFQVLIARLKVKFLYDKPTVFSFSYLVIVTLITLFYSQIQESTGTSIFSLNRYVFATPFFSVFLIYVFRKINFDRNTIGLFFLVLVLCWAAFWNSVFHSEAGSTLHRIRQTLYYFGLPGLYAFLFLPLRKTLKYKLYWMPVYLTGVVLQIYLFNQYLHQVWIG